MIVADNTLLCHFFLRSELGGIARQVREKDGDWIVPALWRAEFANAIVKAWRACPDPVEVYLQTWNAAFDVMVSCERAVDVAEVIRLSTAKRLSAYDAHYAHLALKYGVPLITEDVPLQKAFPGTAVSMAAFLGLGRAPGTLREARSTYRTRRRR